MARTQDHQREIVIACTITTAGFDEETSGVRVANNMRMHSANAVSLAHTEVETQNRHRRQRTSTKTRERYYNL